MTALSEFSEAYPAPAKLNLMLRVVGRRADGYHLLQTVFHFIDYADSLRFRVRTDGVITRFNEVQGVAAGEDICVRAAQALQQASGVTLGADIWLEKRLPLGGGLGGGSSDAATTLLALNRLWQTGFSRTQLMQIAVKLGADVPVFVFGDNALAEGIGEVLRPITPPTVWYVVLCPAVAVSTAAVFADPELKRDSKKLTIQSFSDVEAAGLLSNDLQPLVCRKYPEVARYLSWLAEHSTEYSTAHSTAFAAAHGGARMTGSGACVFAAFGKQSEAARVLAELPADMRGFVARGMAQHPLRDLAL